MILEEGADVCPNQTITYRADVNSRIAATGAVSPVGITGSFVINGNNATVTANYELLDPGSFTNHQATLYIWEDDVTWCCGYGGVSNWDDLTRMVRSTPVSLTTVGQVVQVVQTWNITQWDGVAPNPANLHAAAIFEETAGSLTVIQATDFVSSYPNYFPALTVGQTLKSIPAGNGTATFNCTVQNVGQVSDVLDLSIDNVFGWPADFQVQGDANYYTSHPVSLAAQEKKEITIRVQTDGVKRIGSGTFTVSSQGDNTQVRHATFKLYNGSYAILLVDDDAGTYETPFVNALPALGYLYERITIAPNLSGMIGYDAIIWQTGYAISNVINATDQSNLMAYLDQGGRLFVSSMDCLTGMSNPNTFFNNYLGVASWTVNTKAHTITGVNGDPITNGMSMALSFPSETANRVDTLVPGVGTTIMNSEHPNPCMVRYDPPNHARTVFSTAIQAAFPTAGADPNNSQKFIQNTMTWLLEQFATDVPETNGALASRILSASPNPFTPRTEVHFTLSNRAAGSPVSLMVVDASGRQVRTLANESMTPGTHNVIWDGTDDASHSVASGIYFARLKTVEGESSQKLLRVR